MILKVTKPMKVKICFDTDNEIEVEDSNSHLVAKVINETTKKFFPGTNWIAYEVDFKQ